MRSHQADIHWQKSPKTTTKPQATTGRPGCGNQRPGCGNQGQGRGDQWLGCRNLWTFHRNLAKYHLGPTLFSYWYSKYTSFPIPTSAYLQQILYILIYSCKKKQQQHRTPTKLSKEKALMATNQPTHVCAHAYVTSILNSKSKILLPLCLIMLNFKGLRGQCVKLASNIKFAKTGPNPTSNSTNPNPTSQHSIQGPTGPNPTSNHTNPTSQHSYHSSTRANPSNMLQPIQFEFHQPLWRPLSNQTKPVLQPNHYHHQWYKIPSNAPQLQLLKPTHTQCIP